MRQSKLYYCQMLRTVSKDKYSVPDRYYTSDNWPSNDIIKHENCIIKIKLINLIHVDFCGSINLQNLFYRWLTYRQLKTGKSKGIYQYPLQGFVWNVSIGRKAFLKSPYLHIFIIGTTCI